MRLLTLCHCHPFGTRRVSPVDMIRHQKTCPFTIIHCPNAEAGCSVNIVRSGMASHLESCGFHRCKNHVLKDGQFGCGCTIIGKAEHMADPRGHVCNFKTNEQYLPLLYAPIFSKFVLRASE